MSKELLFWILMLMWLVSDVFGYYDQPTPVILRRGFGSLLLFILLLVLGWAQFGAPVK